MADNSFSVAFRSFLDGLDNDSASQIISTLQSATTRTTSAATLDMSVITGNSNKIIKKRRVSAKTSPPSEKSKRPLNSWMAFRKFYSGSLAPHPQKAISKILTLWWKQELCEAKWAILAKAYSMLRGPLEKQDAPLDEFLSICAPLIGIIPSDQYQQIMGWIVLVPAPDTESKIPETVRAFVPLREDLPEKYATTTLGVDDLVHHCRAIGYARHGQAYLAESKTLDTLTMTAKPTALVSEDTSPLSLYTAASEFDNAFESESFPSHEQLDDQAQMLSMEPQPAPMTKPAGQLMLHAAEEEMMGSVYEYPYYSLFNPEAADNVVFDPYAIDPLYDDGGAWNAYDFMDL